MYFVSEEQKYGNMWKRALFSNNQDYNDHALAPSFNKIFQILIYGSQSNLSEVIFKDFIFNTICQWIKEIISQSFSES